MSDVQNNAVVVVYRGTVYVYGNIRWTRGLRWGKNSIRSSRAAQRGAGGDRSKRGEERMTAVGARIRPELVCPSCRSAELVGGRRGREDSCGRVGAGVGGWFGEGDVWELILCCSEKCE